MYYDKVPAFDALPTPEAKVLAKPTPIAPLLDLVLGSPLPLSVRHADESDLSAGDELVSGLFARLDGGEFKMVPLGERLVAKDIEDESRRLAADIGRELDRSEKADKAVTSGLRGLFSGRESKAASSSTSSSSKEAKSGGDKDKGSSAAKSSKSVTDKSKGVGAAKDGSARARSAGLRWRRRTSDFFTSAAT